MHQCKFDILFRLIGLDYSGTEAYKKAVTFLQFRPTILPRVN